MACRAATTPATRPAQNDREDQARGRGTRPPSTHLFVPFESGPYQKRCSHALNGERAEYRLTAGPRRHTVQAKFYLSADTYERLRREAAERGIKQSALVEEVLQSALA